MESRSTSPNRTFSVIVDGETVRDRHDPSEGAIRLDPSASYVEIRDAVSHELVATLPMMDPEDLVEGPWTTPLELPSGDRMTLTVEAKPAAGEDDLPELSLLVHHEPAEEVARATLMPSRRSVWPRRMLLALAAGVAMFLAYRAGSAVNEQRFNDLLSRYTWMVQERGFKEPLSVRFSVVGQRSLQLDVRVNSRIVSDVFVDWDDPSSPDPVGGTRVFPQPGVRGIEGPVPLAPVVHDYPEVGPPGLWREPRVRVVRQEVPDARWGSLTEEQLNPSTRVWVQPYGIVLDAPEPVLRIVAPKADDVVPSLVEVRLEMDAVAARVHFLGIDATDPSVYQELGSLPPPRPDERAATRIVDTARLGATGRFHLLVMSTSQIAAAAGATVPWHEIPLAAPFDMMELRHAGTIVSPVPGSVVPESGVDVVRAKVLLPGRYAVIAVRPRKEDRYWVQNGPLATSESAEFAVQVSYGGRDTYEVWLGITEDPHAFKAGDRLEDLGRVDAQGRPIYWVGPVEVSHP